MFSRGFFQSYHSVHHQGRSCLGMMVGQASVKPGQAFCRCAILWNLKWASVPGVSWHHCVSGELHRRAVEYAVQWLLLLLQQLSLLCPAFCVAIINASVLMTKLICEGREMTKNPFLTGSTSAVCWEGELSILLNKGRIFLIISSKIQGWSEAITPSQELEQQQSLSTEVRTAHQAAEFKSSVPVPPTLQCLLCCSESHRFSLASKAA